MHSSFFQKRKPEHLRIVCLGGKSHDRNDAGVNKWRLGFNEGGYKGIKGFGGSPSGCEKHHGGCGTSTWVFSQSSKGQPHSYNALGHIQVLDQQVKSDFIQSLWYRGIFLPSLVR